MVVGAADLLTFGQISRQRASIDTFLHTEGSFIERGNAANEAGNRAQLAVVSLGFSEAQDKSQHLENLVGIQAVQDAGSLLGTAVGEGDPEVALAGLGRLAEGSGQIAGTVLVVYAPAEAAVARVRAGAVPGGTVGFAPGEGVSALTANRLQHGTRHLSEAGVLQPWRGSTSPQLIRDALGPVLERPLATFDHVLRGGAPVKGFLGEVNGQQVVLFIYKQGPYQGQLATSVVPSASQLSKWGIP